MYTSVTYEGILQRMLDRIPSTMDKREGSIIYDALAPAAIELQNLYIQLDWLIQQSFGDTAAREYLVRRAVERGITPTPATHAVLKGEFTPIDLDIPIGAKFSIEHLNYSVLEKMAGGEYKMQCDTAGEIGNGQFGNLIPVEYVDGLQTAHLTELLLPGEDEEDTEVFRARYLNSFQSEAFGGNIADYKEKVHAIEGVGGVKVYPVWNGGGTVKLVITDSANAVPSTELITLVQTMVDPVQNQGEGIGIAPIGHIVTVVGAAAQKIRVDLNITYQPDWSWAGVAPYVLDAIDQYFAELASDWENKENVIVRISQIETRILSIEGIVDVQDTVLNGIQQNLVVAADSIPVRGDVIG